MRFSAFWHGAESRCAGIHCSGGQEARASNNIHDVVREAELCLTHARCLWSWAAAASQPLAALEPAPYSTTALQQVHKGPGLLVHTNGHWLGSYCQCMRLASPLTRQLLTLSECGCKDSPVCVAPDFPAGCPDPCQGLVHSSPSYKCGWQAASVCLQIYGDAAAVYAALEQRLQSERDGIFFFGSRPSSLDALLFSHLSYHLGAPSSAPELRQAVGSSLTSAHTHLVHESCLLHSRVPVTVFCSHPAQHSWRFGGTFSPQQKGATKCCQHGLQLSQDRALTAYIESFSQEVFSTALPKAPAIITAEWAQRAEEATAQSSTR